MFLILVITGFLAGVSLGLAKRSGIDIDSDNVTGEYRVTTMSKIQFWVFVLLCVAATAAGTLIGSYLMFELMAAIAPVLALAVVICTFLASFAFGALAALAPESVW